ncbi:MAG: protein kinase [Proteobacteria bacterium]|nr:protein kinase [Pseudomonadota bacterium]
MALPELFGGYLLHQPLAHSEVADVLAAQTTGDFPRPCAIKRIRPELATLPEFNDRFRDDAPLLLRLIHGGLVQVLEVGSVEGQPFVAMELVDGIHLGRLIDDVAHRGSLPCELALHVGIELCEAIGYLQLRRREQFQSAELAPDRAWPLEAMLSFDGVVKVIALGSCGALRIAQQRLADVLAAPGYAAPERVLQQPLDGRAEVFSVGLVLWELFAGQRLLTADAEGYIRGVLDGSWHAPLLTRPDVPSDIIRLVAQMLLIDREARPGTLEQARARLVASLRRLAPDFGTGAVAGLLLRRYPKLIGQTHQLAETLMRRALTVRANPVAHRTLSLGRSGLADRPRGPIKPLKPGARIPGTRYRMVRALGHGGGAEVIAAQHIDLDRQAALKILAPELALQSDAIAQFRLEARTCGRIGHPNIVDVIDFGELDDGRFFFAMELLRGETLAARLDRLSRLPAGEAIGIFRQITRAVQAAHEHGIIHRDLKPENVMLIEKDGRADFVKVLDFGVMAFAEDERGERVGTPGYMAPEQLVRAKPSTAIDIWALGATLYETLCGELPYAGETVETYQAQLRGSPAPALRSRKGGRDLPPPLERVVHRALERDPAARHPSAADFEADLVRAQRQAGIASPWDDLPLPEHVRDRRPSTPVDRVPLLRGRRRAMLAFAATALTVLAGLALGYFGSPARRAPREQARVRAATTLTTTGLPSPSATPPASAAAPGVAAPAPPAEAPARAGAGGAAAALGDSTTSATPRVATRPRPAPAPADLSASGQPALAARAADLVARGEVLLAQLQLRAADEAFRNAIAADALTAPAYAGLAAVAFQHGRYVDAVRAARQALAVDPRLVRAHLLLGDAYLQLQRRNEAIAAWRQAQRLDPGNRVASQRLARAEPNRAGAE